MAINLTDPIFTDETKAREHLEAIRWPDGKPYCPHCGETQHVYRLNGKSHRAGLIHCNSCEGSFTVTTGSVMESSHLPLNKWVLAYRLMASSKKGMSAHQLHRTIGVTYKTAWFLWHRIREAMREGTPEPSLGGAGRTVEVDETYVGGKPRKGTNTKGKSGRGTKKTPVVALVERGGRVRSRKIEHVDAATLKGAIRENVNRKSRIVTDEWRSYIGIGKEFEGGHEVILHSSDEFARDDVNTNTVESYFALLKRGVVGSFHHISKEHLDRYCDEFSFRWNRRDLDDTERAAAIVKGGVGKRLTYRRPRGTEQAAP